MLCFTEIQKGQLQTSGLVFKWTLRCTILNQSLTVDPKLRSYIDFNLSRIMFKFELGSVFNWIIQYYDKSNGIGNSAPRKQIYVVLASK